MSKLYLWFNEHFPKYLLAAVLVIVPLFPKFPLFSVPGTYVAVRFEDILLLVLFVITVIGIAKNFKAFIGDEIIQAFLIFFGINLISLLAGIFLTQTVSPLVGILNYLRRLEYFVPFFAIITLFKAKAFTANLSYYLKILVIVTIVAFAYGVGQRYLFFPIITTQNDQYSKGVALRWTPGSHISSTFAGHYDMAALMVMLIPLFLCLIIFLKGTFARLTFLVSGSGALWLLINSLSRISQVSYLAAITVSLMLIKKFRILAGILILSIILIVNSSSLKARFDRVIDVFIKKVQIIKIVSIVPRFTVKAATEALPSLRTNLVSPTPTPIPIFEDRSTSIRLNVEWPRAIRAFKINPLLGTGYSSITLATDNDYLRMLGETGILGFAAFVLIFLRIGRTLLIGIRNLGSFDVLEKSAIVGTVGGIVGTFISAFFIDIFEASKFAIMFWFMCGAVVAIVRSKTNV